MKLFRRLGRIYKNKYFKRSSKSKHSSFEDCFNRRIRFEAKLKVNKKYKQRSLEIVRRASRESGTQEWMLYVVKYADYTSYDSFNLSKNFITQLFNSRDSKCTLVLVEDVLQLKMASVSDKWRLVEFLRANLDTNVQIFEGSLSESSGRKNAVMTSSYQARLFFNNFTIAIVDVAANTVRLHSSLCNFEMVVCKEGIVSFFFKSSANTLETWSFLTEKLGNFLRLASYICNSRSLHHLPYSLHREPPKHTQPPQVLYTDF